MKIDVTKLTYGEIEKVLAMVRGTPFYVSKLGGNVLVTAEVSA